MSSILEEYKPIPDPDDQWITKTELARRVGLDTRTIDTALRHHPPLSCYAFGPGRKTRYFTVNLFKQWSEKHALITPP